VVGFSITLRITPDHSFSRLKKRPEVPDEAQHSVPVYANNFNRVAVGRAGENRKFGKVGNGTFFGFLRASQSAAIRPCAGYAALVLVPAGSKGVQGTRCC
jgi:hypothetical protein